jgi:hypothetical protein
MADCGNSANYDGFFYSGTRTKRSEKEAADLALAGARSKGWCGVAQQQWGLIWGRARHIALVPLRTLARPAILLAQGSHRTMVWGLDQWTSSGRAEAQGSTVATALLLPLLLLHPQAVAFPIKQPLLLHRCRSGGRQLRDHTVTYSTRLWVMRACVGQTHYHSLVGPQMVYVGGTAPSSQNPA